MGNYIGIYAIRVFDVEAAFVLAGCLRRSEVNYEFDFIYKSATVSEHKSPFLACDIVHDTGHPPRLVLLQYLYNNPVCHFSTTYITVYD